MPAKVTIENLSSYSREELQNSLAMLRQYRRIARSLGKRAPAFFERLRSGEVTVRAETGPHCDHAAILAVLDKRFPDLGLAGLSGRITWSENPDLEGGIRLFVGDEMIDASYRRIRTELLS